tara:strand:+ start:94 stop:1146 length:1053 start_codon:yes stop_codon:yes gene_type:complete
MRRATPTLLLAATALATESGSGSDGGTSACPCIAWDASSFLASDGSSITTTLGGTSYGYPLSYGTDCGAHDQTLQPYCDSSVAEPPEWCAQPWCYVDKNNCDHPASKSSYYASQSLSYSYRTCGGQNTFSSWFGDNAVSSGGHTLPDIIDTVEGYLKAITNALEVNHWELQKQVQTCSFETSCDCGTCASGRGEWGPQDVDYQISTLTVRNDLRSSAASSASDAMRREECLASIVGNDFVRIAAIEANISRLGYEYYASQQLGSYVQWPGLQWCTDSCARTPPFQLVVPLPCRCVCPPPLAAGTTRATGRGTRWARRGRRTCWSSSTRRARWWGRASRSRARRRATCSTR